MKFLTKLALPIALRASVVASQAEWVSGYVNTTDRPRRCQYHGPTPETETVTNGQ